MINNEAYLLYSALCYERGHCRRTQHILKVYALAKLLGEQERISTEEQQIFLVGHHHTYTNIDGIDYQILVEADFLVNFYEDELRQDSIQTAFDKIFRTESGKTICRISYFTEWKDQ